LKAAREIKRLYVFAGFLIGGLLLMVLGIAMVTSPSLRDDPRQITMADFARGGITGFCGIAIILLGWWRYRNSKRAAKSKAARLLGLLPEELDE
jgi:hypothetical protein